MSGHPPKKSDLKKSWMKKRLDRAIKMPPEYHLIVTEGKETEPRYFGAIRDVINQKYRGRVQLDIRGEGGNTLGLLELAQKLAASSINGYSHVWVVFDTDDFPADHINRTVEGCANATTGDTTFHAIWSNQSIEIWFLLHFELYHSAIHRSAYEKRLTEHLAALHAGSYTKTKGGMFALLRPYMGTAITNAKKLEALNVGKTPADSAPGTKVFELIELLWSYLDD